MNVSKGDLAVILKSEAAPECVGWYVTVGDFIPDREEAYWWISHAPMALASATQSMIPDAWLKRVPPLAELEGEKRGEEITA